MRAIHKVAVLGAALVAFGTFGVGTALADPYPPLSSPPALTTIEGVGSDTITPLFSGNELTTGGQTSGDITQDYDATSPANLLYSWDAVQPNTGTVGDTITTKASSSSDTTCSMARPDGSSAGITALEANKMDGSDFCIDYARSSRAPVSTDPTTIAFAPLAGDAITWSTPEGSGVTSPVPNTLTLAQLVAIYNCTDTNWNQVGGSNAPIVAVLPQNGSGTRSTFLLALGGGVTPLTPGTCVVNGTNSTGAIEENTGLSAPNVAQFGTTATSTTVDDIFPYSVGDYIAQGPLTHGVGGHATSIWGHGDLALHNMTTNSGTLESPTTTNSSSQPVINRNFESQLQRVLYAVVRNGGTAAKPAFPTSPAYDAVALPAIFGPSGWICKNATGQADIISYGFYSEGANCGALTDSSLIG